MLSRRDLFRLGAAGAAAMATGGGSARAAAASEQTAAGGKKMIPLGLQLYSVRSECAKDPAGTIAAVAKMGYEAVEFAGYYNKSAADLRKMLDQDGIVCCGTHTALATLQGDELAKTIEFNKTLGNRFLIVPSLPKERTATKKAWQETAALFNELSDKVKPHGMRVGYHNHSVEFKPLDGELPWETFFGATKPEVVMQVDIGNALGGGGDPVAMLKKFPGRAATIHLKPFSKSNPKAVIGEDEVPWAEVFDLCEKGGTEWYIVEYEVPGLPPLEAVAQCLEGLRKMGKA